MKKVVDYTKFYQEDFPELDVAEKSEPLSGRDLKVRDQLFKIAELIQSQYQCEKDAARWDEMENKIFPQLCEIAELQYGRVEMELDEKELVARVIYTGKELLLNRDSFYNLAAWTAIVSKASEVCIMPQGDMMQIFLIFSLYKKTKIADHSEQIAAEKAKLRQL